jgi:hypothetical protein
MDRITPYRLFSCGMGGFFLILNLKEHFKASVILGDSGYRPDHKTGAIKADQCSKKNILMDE